MTPEPLGRVNQGAGPEFEATGTKRVSQRLERRVKFAQQSWPEFFRGLLVEAAIIAAIVGAFALYLWWVNH